MTSTKLTVITMQEACWPLELMVRSLMRGRRQCVSDTRRAIKAIQNWLACVKQADCFMMQQSNVHCLISVVKVISNIFLISGDEAVKTVEVQFFDIALPHYSSTS